MGVDPLRRAIHQGGMILLFRAPLVIEVAQRFDAGAKSCIIIYSSLLLVSAILPCNN